MDHVGPCQNTGRCMQMQDKHFQPHSVVWTQLLPVVSLDPHKLTPQTLQSEASSGFTGDLKDKTQIEAAISLLQSFAWLIWIFRSVWVIFNIIRLQCVSRKLEGCYLCHQPVQFFGRAVLEGRRYLKLDWNDWNKSRNTMKCQRHNHKTNTPWKQNETNVGRRTSVNHLWTRSPNSSFLRMVE